jgi:hypothetical protein
MPSRTPAKECEVFLNFLYGEETGWVYAPVKAPGAFDKHFFEWPRQRKELVRHVLSNEAHDVYIAPALFKTSANAQLGNVRGSNVVWADYDGNAPSDAVLAKAKLPVPAARIQSSIPGHEHVYWKLDQFETDLKTFQDVNKAIAYATDADLSGWDASQVLRPVGSVNHKRNSAVATVKTFAEVSYAVTEFDRIPSVDKIHFDEAAFKAMGKVPSTTSTVHKYVWTDQELNLLYRKPAHPGELEGKRGSLLFRIANMCAEKGMPDSHIYAIVSGIDKQPGWHKYSERENPERSYIRMIDKVRQKHPYRSDADKISGFEVVTFLQHFEEEVEIEYILDGYIAPQSFNIILGKSASGKTNLGNYICRSLALGRDVMHWRNVSGKPMKMVYFSYEMNRIENRMRFDEWIKFYDKDEIQTIQNNYIPIYPSGDPVRFYDLVGQARVIAAIEALRPSGILIDSASMSMAADMSDEVSVKSSVEFVKNFIKRYNLFAIVIHHPRKEVAGTKSKEYSVDEAHGAQALINQCTTCINITQIFKPGEEQSEDSPPGELMVNISWRKNRLGPRYGTFRAELRPDLTFARPTIAAIAAPKALTVGRQTDRLAILAEQAKAKKKNEF